MTRWVWTFDDPSPHPLPASAVELLQWEVVALTEVEAWEKIRDTCADLLSLEPRAAELMVRAARNIATLTGEGTPCSMNG